MWHWTVFIMHQVVHFFVVFFILNVFFSLFSVFCPSHLIISIDGSWLMEPKWIYITTSVLRHTVFPKYVTNISFGDRSTNIFCIKTLATYNNWRHSFQWKISPTWKNRLEDIWKRLKYMQYDKKNNFCPVTGNLSLVSLLSDRRFRSRSRRKAAQTFSSPVLRYGDCCDRSCTHHWWRQGAVSSEAIPFAAFYDG